MKYRVGFTDLPPSHLKQAQLISSPHNAGAIWGEEHVSALLSSLYTPHSCQPSSTLLTILFLAMKCVNHTNIHEILVQVGLTTQIIGPLVISGFTVM